MGKTPSENPYCTNCSSPQQGFALPLALVAIALLSTITLAGYRAVTGAVEIASVVDDNTQTELAFFSAETESVFTFLTSPPVQNGILTRDANETDPDAPEAIFGFARDLNIESLDAADHWRADGETRISITNTRPVTVAYHDASGFAPISALPEEETVAILTAAGFKPDVAAQFAARIGDFQDEDKRRRFRGAEATDYRLYGVSAPTNSPLRTPGELASVLGFADAASQDQWDFFIENVNFGGISTQFTPDFGPPALAELFENTRENTNAPNALDNSAESDANPTATARFLLAYRLQSGLTRRRAVEIIRTANAADRPFRRIRIYDKAKYEQGDATPTIEQRGLAPVFPAIAGTGTR